MELLESSVKLDFQTLRQEIVAEIRKRMIDVFRRIDEKVEHVLSTEHREYIYICMACFRHYLPASVLYEEVPALKLEGMMYIPEMIAFADREQSGMFSNMLKTRALNNSGVLGPKTFVEYIMGRQFISHRPVHRLSRVGLAHGIGGFAVLVRWMLAYKMFTEGNTDHMTSYIQWHGVAKIVGNISFLEEIITDYRVDMKYARMRYETRKDSNIPRDPHVKTLVKETLIEILSTYGKELRKYVF